jgi:hypothetical protein
MRASWASPPSPRPTPKTTAPRARGASEGLRSDPGDAVQERIATEFFEPARERHGADAWDAAEREGRALSFADAVAYGLEEPRA